MSSPVPTFDEYLSTLGRLSAHVDPMLTSPEAERIRDACASLASLAEVTIKSLSDWAKANPKDADVLALTVGLTQERMKNVLRDQFDTSGIVTLARERPVDLVTWLDTEYNLVPTITVQRRREFTFGDVLVARAGSRVRATSAGVSGRKVEDEIEAIAVGLGLEVQTRTRFEGRNGRTAPCDLLILQGTTQHIAVAAKGFDSTGSKLTDAVREIEEMADVRKPTQFIMAVIDGIGWKSRQADLRRIHALWESGQIDGVYTLVTLDRFRDDLEDAARRLGLTQGA
jgi:hypothetical protein